MKLSSTALIGSILFSVNSLIATAFSGIRTDAVSYSTALIAWTTPNATASIIKYEISSDGYVPFAGADAALELMSVKVEGDLLRFSRTGPFGVYSWTKKQTELNRDETMVWERAQARAPQWQSEEAPIYVTAHQFFLSGLLPNTLYTYRVCATQSDCSQPYSFRTLARIGDPSPTSPRQISDPLAFPKAPTPEINGNSYAVAEDCSDFQAMVYAAAGADGSRNHQVLIPTTADCTIRSNKIVGMANEFNFEFPAKYGINADGLGEIIIRTAAPGSVLPKEGTRVTQSHRSQMPVLRNSSWGVQETYSPASNGSCVIGQPWWQFNQPGWSLKECSDAGSNSYALASRIDFTGAAPLTNCEASRWYFKADEPSNVNGIYWCATGGKLYNMSLGRNAAFTFAPGAHHYRFLGLQFSSVPMGDRPWARSAVYSDGSYYVGHFVIPQSTHHITFDRCYFSGLDYPDRIQNVIYSAASYLTITDSVIEMVSHWLPSSEFGDIESTAVQLTGGAFIRIKNNSIESAGITVFASADNPGSMTSDVELVGNTIRRPMRYRAGSPENLQLPPQFHQSRHLLELKRGVRWRIDGNVFDGNFATVNQAHMIALSPRPGGMSWESSVALTDIQITNNSIRNGPNGILVIGHHDFGNGQLPATSRVAINNNLITGIDGALAATGTPGRTGGCFTVLFGVEDLAIKNNTCVDQNGYWPAFLWEQYGPSAGLNFQNNIVSVKSGDGYGGLVSPGAARGTASLKKGFPGAWTFAYNALINLAAEDPKSYPPGNCWFRSNEEIGWVDYRSGDYRLQSISPLVTGGQCSYDGATALPSGIQIGISYAQLARAQGL